MTPATQSAIIMLVSGISIPVLAALNASLGQKLASPAAAALVLFAIAFGATLLVTIVTGGSLAGVPSAPKHLFLGGIFVAFYITSITWIAPKFGVGNAVFFVLLGQLISAAIIDHFGLFGAKQISLNMIRLSGIGLMVIGVFLTQIASRT